MSNEELAMQIKQGNKSAVMRLWTAVQAFIYKCCFGFYNSKKDLCLSSGVTIDDLIQVSYFALLNAVDSFEPTKGYKLLTYMTYHLKNEFNELTGIRTSKTEPLNYSKSLNTPINDTDDTLELMDTISDAKNDMEMVDDKLYNDSLHMALNTAMNKLQPISKEIIQDFYYNGYTVKEIAKKHDITESKTHSLKYNGLTALSRDVRLQEYRNNIISRSYRWHYSTWENTGYSSTEYTAIKLIERENKTIKNTSN